eukprot:TRINITY_DN23847_c0_g1_i1.p1 TRINITY_DN23847_c0_g1~~TRINITY_DN23847_c0_g1_i1.p1  ORF type:complete len:336 (-),score=80.02 TRINITY_DN23847_c0_g1_i1:91-1098(-)
MERHVDDTELLELFKGLSTEAQDLYISPVVPRIECPTPLEFFREYVSQNRPCIITGAINHWPALHKWTNDYLERTIGDNIVTVDWTPNGYGDAVTPTPDGPMFVEPERRHMKFSEFLSINENPRDYAGVYYVQHQNGNLRSEFSTLFADVDMELPFATEAFGAPPDVQNFWMGESRSVTSLHKDHYENIYAVIAGEKHFTLYPPTDLYFLYERRYKRGTFRENMENEARGFDIDCAESDNEVPWISVDPDRPDYDAFPRFRHASPIMCTVKPGELLYLPSLYFHHVKQSDRTIAVNFWYDMRYDLKWCYFKFLEHLVTAKHGVMIPENAFIQKKN